MINHQTAEEIVGLHAEFLAIKKYKDRILFFDQHFKLMENSFPAFNPNLDILFKQEEINILVEIFENERRNVFFPEKKFHFNGEHFVFNVVPLNSYPEILNDYIISKFLDADSHFQKIMALLKSAFKTDASLIEKWKTASTENISLIANKLASGNETSLRNQFMTVFYHGYLDHIQNNIKKFSRRKKVIELYLYSQGILFGRYLEALNQYSLALVKQLPREPAYTPVLDWTGRVLLFKELGILDLLMGKYRDAQKPDPEKKVAQVLCLILGENLQMSDKIMHYIKTGSIKR